jgi:transposase
MSKRKVTKYTSEFRENAIKLALESDQPIAHTANNLGVNVNTLHTWISKYGPPSENQSSFNEHHFDEIKRLKKQLMQVTQERDLLKKAAAYFAKEI